MTQKKHEKHVAFATLNELLNTPSNLVREDEAYKKNSRANSFTYEKRKTGQDQTVIVKRFDQHSYNGPTLNDFIERLNSVFEAAEYMIKEQNEHVDIKLKRLNKERNDIERHLREDCDILPIALEDLLKKEPEVLKKIEQATQYIGQFIKNCVPLLQQDKASYAETMKTIVTLAESESKRTEDKGRPNFINYYPSSDRNVERVSIHRLVGDAIPSTERQQEKLPNLGECSIGYKAKNGEYKEQFRGYRHSSYPPIKMANEEQRKQATQTTVKQMLAELAQQALNKKEQDTDKDHPLKITLSSLGLFSPINMDYGLIGDESEHRQLTESYQALMSYHNTSVEVEIQDNKNPGQLKKVYIKPEINLLNAPSNPHGVWVQHHASYLLMNNERMLNAQGVMHFADQTIKYLFGDLNIHPAPNITRLMDLLKTIEEDNITLRTVAESVTQSNAINNKILKRYNEFTQFFNEHKHEILQELKQEASSHVPDEKRENDLDVAELAFQTISMQITQTLEPPQYGARYLLACHKMGHFVDFYCKSGEDRTGRLQNLIEELSEFKRRYNEYPAYNLATNTLDEHDLATQRIMAQKTSEFSVSRDINDQNVHGARGLQITSGMNTNAGLPNQSGDLIGKLARRPFEVARRGLAKEHSSSMNELMWSHLNAFSVTMEKVPYFSYALVLLPYLIAMAVFTGVKTLLFGSNKERAECKNTVVPENTDHRIYRMIQKQHNELSATSEMDEDELFDLRQKIQQNIHSLKKIEEKIIPNSNKSADDFLFEVREELKVQEQLSTKIKNMENRKQYDINSDQESLICASRKGQ